MAVLSIQALLNGVTLYGNRTRVDLSRRWPCVPTGDRYAIHEYKMLGSLLLNPVTVCNEKVRLAQIGAEDRI
jgi:hypothetical protein